MLLFVSRSQKNPQLKHSLRKSPGRRPVASRSESAGEYGENACARKNGGEPREDAGSASESAGRCSPRRGEQRVLARVAGRSAVPASRDGDAPVRVA